MKCFANKFTRLQQGKDDHPRKNLLRDFFAPKMNEEHIAQVYEKIDGRMTIKGNLGILQKRVRNIRCTVKSRRVFSELTTPGAIRKIFPEHGQGKAGT